MAARAFITGLQGTAITAPEREFLRDAAPFGLILFKRNILAPDQVAALIADFRDLCGPDAAVLIDQEGGRVQRMGPPHWPAYPAGAVYGALYRRDAAAGVRAAWLGGRLIAADLAAVGITVDCLPLADVPVKGADSVIGDRAYGDTPAQVARLAMAMTQGLKAGGVLPVVKHIPGHGRATADSHQRLPVVTASRAELEANDFAAFLPLAGEAFGMTAHVVFTAFDPGFPATTSAIMIEQVIRGSIAFAGALMSDDVSMGALAGPVGERAARCFSAGCDLVLHCNGDLAEMQEVAANAPELGGEAQRRVMRALAQRRSPEPLDAAAARAELNELVSGRAGAAIG